VVELRNERKRLNDYIGQHFYKQFLSSFSGKFVSSTKDYTKTEYCNGRSTIGISNKKDYDTEE